MIRRLINVITKIVAKYWRLTEISQKWSKTGKACCADHWLPFMGQVSNVDRQTW